jgi:hypothetical protein
MIITVGELISGIGCMYISTNKKVHICMRQKEMGSHQPLERKHMPNRQHNLPDIAPGLIKNTLKTKVASTAKDGPVEPPKPVLPTNERNIFSMSN